MWSAIGGRIPVDDGPISSWSMGWDTDQSAIGQWSISRGWGEGMYLKQKFLTLPPRKCKVNNNYRFYKSECERDRRKLFLRHRDRRTVTRQKNILRRSGCFDLVMGTKTHCHFVFHHSTKWVHESSVIVFWKLVCFVPLTRVLVDKMDVKVQM